MEIYPRGSEWRRWDLHIHTPGTQKNDQFNGKDINEKWDNFYRCIDDYIGDASSPEKIVSVVGITDYMSIDNYKKVISDHRLNKNIKFVLPNVEMRMFPFAKNAPINIHCLFNPSIVDELEDRFFGKLSFHYDGVTYSATHSELQRLGRKIKFDESIDNEKAYQIGLNQFIVDVSTVRKVFDEDRDLRENTIIAVSNNSDDGVSGIIKHSDLFINNGMSQTEATRREIYRISDLIFSAQNSDRKYFLGQGPDNVEIVKEKCGSLKGCIHGCDAHTNSKIFEPSQHRYCWVKADPTFNGLKQVIYEPETRVCISAIKPEEKPDYQVIESMTIGDAKTQDEKIVFNDKLTCIIGGKSTGKSLLLHNLAMAIDPDQVREKADITNQKIKGRQLDDVVVRWRDGSIAGDINQPDRKIVYIPQTYLNRLSDENEELTEIDEIIKNVVLISPEAKQADIKMQEALKNQKTKMEKLIYEVISSYKTIENKKLEEAEIGTVDGIKKELDKLNLLKEKQTKDGTISEDEIVKYNSSNIKSKKLEKLIFKLSEDIEYINTLDSVVCENTQSYTYEDENKIIVEATVDEIIKEADKLWKSKRKDLIKQIEDRVQKKKEEKIQLDKIINTLRPKIEGNESIKKLSEAIQVEDAKLARVISEEKEIGELKSKCSEAIQNLAQEFLAYREIREVYRDTINNRINLSKDDLDFSVETPFRIDAFIDGLKGIINSNSLKAAREWIDIDNITSEWITLENIIKLIKECLNGNLKFLKKKDNETALREILADWNNTTYRVSMDGDSIDGMSPGKKALVLLKLLINLAESTCPILIDQPEDDLDNRSIFSELIPFIKNKKIQRQIIIVTHNANVVLGGDAEEIIVANQNGKNTPNEKYRFEYRTGSIEEDRVIENRVGVLNSRGIQQHICDVLEGGERAFDLRKHKYQI